MSKSGVYDLENTIISTICSHSAFQIFKGARDEGFKSLGITVSERKEAYTSLPFGAPDEFLEVGSFKELLNEDIQEILDNRKVLLIPHGSFVEYVGAKAILTELKVPIFGNKKSLEWESSREKVAQWMRMAGLNVPKYKSPDEIDSLCIVKMGGAKGGKGFFLVESEEEFYKKLGNRSTDDVVIQEYVLGVRYYHHFFHSMARGRVELLGVDQRLESNVDALHRVTKKIEPTYTVTGNAPVVLRESLIPHVLTMGEGVVAASKELFFPGITGPFCIETICTPDLKFYSFEISGRIVAGTNLYPNGSQYSCYYFNEPMSTGRRIAREIKEAIQQGSLDKIIS